MWRIFKKDDDKVLGKKSNVSTEEKEKNLKALRESLNTPRKIRSDILKEKKELTNKPVYEEEQNEQPDLIDFEIDKKESETTIDKEVIVDKSEETKKKIQEIVQKSNERFQKKHSEFNTNQNIITENSTKKNKEKLAIPIQSQNINLTIIENSFKNIIENYDSDFLYGSLIEKETNKAISGFNTDQYDVSFIKNLIDKVNYSTDRASFTRLNRYFLIDLKEGKIIMIIMFKKHFYMLLFSKSTMVLGQILYILKPKLIEDYKKAINAIE